MTEVITARTSNPPGTVPYKRTHHRVAQVCDRRVAVADPPDQIAPQQYRGQRIRENGEHVPSRCAAGSTDSTAAGLL